MVGNIRELEENRFFDELVDRDAAAQILEVSPRTLDRWHLLREGPPRIRYGRMVRYRLSAIENWLTEHEISPLVTATERQTKHGFLVKQETVS